MKTSTDRSLSPSVRWLDTVLMEHWMHEAVMAEMMLDDAATPTQKTAAQSRLDEAERVLALFRA